MKPVSALITTLKTQITTLRAQVRIQAQHQIRTGRHQAPFSKKKTYLRAGAVALGLAAGGAVAAGPLTSSLEPAAPSASLRQAEFQARTAQSRSAKAASIGHGGFAGSAAAHGSRPSHTAGSAHGTRLAQSPSHPAHRKTAGRRPSVQVMRCTGTTGMLPQNYATIVSFLTTHGYTKMAAAGIAGNIYQESMGSPESVGTGGGGLIGWTPLPPGFVTGNVAADLHTQLEALLTYNQQWAQYIPALNAATSPTQAADVYMNYFERPGIPAAYNREGAAAAVASACGF